MRIDLVLAHEVRDAIGEHAGLARAGARQDEERPLGRGDGVALSRIEDVQIECHRNLSLQHADAIVQPRQSRYFTNLIIVKPVSSVGQTSVVRRAAPAPACAGCCRTCRRPPARTRRSAPMWRVSIAPQWRHMRSRSIPESGTAGHPSRADAVAVVTALSVAAPRANARVLPMAAATGSSSPPSARSPARSSDCGPSESALRGSGCASTISPSAPIAMAARHTGRHEVALARRVRRVDDDRQHRELVDDGHRRDVEREACRRLERADARARTGSRSGCAS